MVQTAELARHQGIDLYSYVDERGIGLKTALDYHADFAGHIQQNDWPYEQIKPLKAEPVEESDSMALYEMAYAHWPEPQYLSVIESWGRPMTERRVHWHISLTHAGT